MARFYVIARSVTTTTLTRSSSVATLTALGTALYDEFKVGGPNDIAVTKAYVQWEHVNGVDDFQVVVETDSLAAVQTNIGSFKTTVRTGILAQASLTAVSVDTISVVEQGSVASATGSAVQAYVGSGTPGSTNDSADTAGLGTAFAVGSTWVRTSTPRVTYICEDATPSAAVWNVVGEQVPLGPTSPVALYVDYNPARAWDEYATPALILTFNGTLTAVTRRGLSVIRFAATGYAVDNTNVVAPPTSWTIVAAICPEAFSASKPVFIGSASNGASKNTWGFYITSAGAVAYIFGDGTNASYGTAGLLTLNRWAVVTVRYTAGQNAAVVWINGVSQSVTAASTAATASTCGGNQVTAVARYGAFADYTYEGKVGRVWVYNSALSDANRAAVENKLIAAFVT